MMLFYLIALLVLVGTETIKILVEPEITKIFIYEPKELEWKKANNYCRMNYGNNAGIAIPHSMKANKMIQKMYKDNLDQNEKNGWIGYYKVNGFWYNSYKKTVNNPFYYFANNFGNEDCIFMKKKNGKWKTEKCDMKKKFICQLYIKRKKVPINFSCPNKWKFVVDKKGFKHCIRMYKKERKWIKAKNKCFNKGPINALNVHLAIPNDKKVNKFINDMQSDNKPVWIGITDLYTNPKKNKWLTVEGNKLSYKNWKQNQPNNLLHDCVYMKDSNGKWYDDLCTDKKRYVCEFKQQYLY